MESLMKSNKSLKKLKESFNLLSNEPMKQHTSIQVGGPADLFAIPETKDELINLIKEAQNKNINLTIIGDGTNLLITDKGIRGLVISTKKFKQKISIKEIAPETFIVNCLAGSKLSALCNFALNNNLQGLEFAAGIPGTVGGAVAMNTGTPGGSMSDIVNSVGIVTDSGEVLTISRNNLDFKYRKLNELNGLIIEVSFLLKNGAPDTIKKTFNQNLEKKKSTQPWSSKSGGCIFKNPENGTPAGKLIDMAGLKSIQIGDAMVSEKHANFIINTGNAKCTDILHLKHLIEDKIQRMYSVKLETEIIIKGEE